MFSPSIKLSMIAEVPSLETLYTSISLLPPTICDLHFVFLHSLTTPDTYIISLSHFHAIPNSTSLATHPSIHLSTNLLYLLDIKYSTAWHKYEIFFTSTSPAVLVHNRHSVNIFWITEYTHCLKKKCNKFFLPEHNQWIITLALNSQMTI